MSEHVADVLWSNVAAVVSKSVIAHAVNVTVLTTNVFHFMSNQFRQGVYHVNVAKVYSHGCCEMAFCLLRVPLVRQCVSLCAQR